MEILIPSRVSSFLIIVDMLSFFLRKLQPRRMFRGNSKLLHIPTYRRFKSKYRAQNNLPWRVWDAGSDGDEWWWWEVNWNNTAREIKLLMGGGSWKIVTNSVTAEMGWGCWVTRNGKCYNVIGIRMYIMNEKWTKLQIRVYNYGKFNGWEEEWSWEQFAISISIRIDKSFCGWEAGGFAEDKINRDKDEVDGGLCFVYIQL